MVRATGIYLPMLRTLTHLPHPLMRPVYEQPVVTRAIDNNRFVLNPTLPLYSRQPFTRTSTFATFFHKNPSPRIHFKSTPRTKVLYLFFIHIFHIALIFT